MTIVRGTISCPDGANEPRREIAINRQEECKKLFQFPVTCSTNPKGIGIILSHADRKCEASIHRRSTGEFWIGSASRRLSREYVDLYREFIKGSGLSKCGIEVTLTFEGYQVHIV